MSPDCARWTSGALHREPVDGNAGLSRTLSPRVSRFYHPARMRNALAVFLLLGLTVACAPAGSADLLSDVSARRTPLSPGVRQNDNRFDVHYTLGAPGI